MNRFALGMALLGWFFMFRVPHPDQPGINLTVLVGIFETKGECEREYKKIASDLRDAEDVKLVKCENAEEI